MNFNNLSKAEKEFIANIYLSIKEWEASGASGTGAFAQVVEDYIAERDGAK